MSSEERESTSLWLKDLMQEDSVAFGLSKAKGKREKTSLIDESEGFYSSEADKETIKDMLISDDDNGSNPGVRFPPHDLRARIVDKGAKSRHEVDGPDAERMTEATTGEMPGETKEVVQKISGSSSFFGSSISRETGPSYLLKFPRGSYLSILLWFVVPVLLATLLAYITISPKIQEDDVFLSFNREEPSDEELLVISTLLHTALDQESISAFMAFKEKRREVLKAIDVSRVAVIILSQGYASCRRCLEELAMIIEGHQGAQGKTVVPILYKSSQEDLLQQNEEFAKGYLMHEENVKHLDKVYRWRHALRQAVNRPGGWDYRSYSSESELIGNVVQDVAAKLRTETESSSTATKGKVAERWVPVFLLLVFCALMAAIAVALQAPEESCECNVFVNCFGELTLVSELSQILEENNISTFKDEGLVSRKHITLKIFKAIHRAKVAIIILSPGYANFPCCLDELVEIIECHRTKGLAIVPVRYNVQQPFLEDSIRSLHFGSRRVQSWKKALNEAAGMPEWIFSEREEDFEVFVGEICKEVARKLGKMKVTDLEGTGLRSMEASSSSSFGVSGGACPPPADTASASASTSSSPSSSSARIDQPKKYGVFLSFRGAGVRDKFVSHIYQALCLHGIPTFLDDKELDRGKPISEILEAISESYMAVVIFSANYADSTLSLDELVKILECKETQGLMVLPVFYGVDPGAVASQTGCFEKAFAKHVPEKNEEGRSRVKRWRTAVKEVANISGWDARNIRPDSTLIEEIVEDISRKLGYGCLNNFEGMGEIRSSANRKTTSLVDEFEGFYGRDADKKAIIDMLISEDDNGSNPGVIPIVGMGSVGETTLAQHVYNDKAVERRFEIRAWVYVSDRFDETKLTKEIVEKVTKTACHHNDLDQVQGELKEALKEKKFLLILDDVWSGDYEEWRRLLSPLRSGAKGSKIIVNTRSRQMASKVQRAPTHYLRELEDEYCWKLFARHACLDVNSTANPPELQEIGKQIVRKCGGLPLAAKALGGVLRRETKVEKWKEVLKSEIWEVQNANILPALAISYIQLASHPKRCFAYCAIFPQDYEFEKEKLVALWMSEGFLVQQKGKKSLEEIGDMYFDDLVSRSFFHGRDHRDGLRFVMHDLVRDLARFVSGEFCSRLEGGTSPEIGEKTRHLSYERTKEGVLEKFQVIDKTPFLRSFVLAENSRSSCYCYAPVKCFNSGDIDRLLSTRKLLRVMSLSCYEVQWLPNSIGNLKHMRHLDLSETSICWLPEAVTDLFNLEILILRECQELSKLPDDMARLINLCQLDLRGTHLLGMPPEMGKLKKLSKLSDFVVGKNGGSSIKELGQLHYLRGKISIGGLQNVKDDRDASEAILKDKENLKVLRLSWRGYGDDSGQAKQVLERLQPHVQIESIEICGYRGTEFPNWVGINSFSKLKELRLNNSENCVCLPPLGQLASLEELKIEHYKVLEAISLEFYGMCKPGEKPFSSLKTLVFSYMENWREWGSCNGAFPVLEELELRNCPKLMTVRTRLPSLKRLWIDKCGELDMKNWVGNNSFSKLKELRLNNSENCVCLPPLGQLTSLEELKIEHYEVLEAISLEFYGMCKPGEKPFSSLKTLVFSDMENWKEWGYCNGAFPVLEELELRNCPKLMTVRTYLPSLKRLWIDKCGELDMKNWREWGYCNGAFPVLEELELRNCPKQMTVPTHLPSLKRLWIDKCGELDMKDWGVEELVLRNCPKLMSVPTHLPSLKRLRIYRCGELDTENLSVSTCLETIRIEESHKVKCIPLENLPSLKELEVSSCANLESLVGSTAAAAATTTRTSDPLFSPSLTSLRISCCHKLLSFPRGGLHAPNLKSMYLYLCLKLKSLPQGMHSLLPSLEELTIYSCPGIESLPEEGLPSSLSYLKILDCGFLKKRCEREIGEDWPKIKNIPHLDIL